MGKFEKIIKEVKKLNQARKFNIQLNGKGKNEGLLVANSFIIRAKLKELEKRKELGIWKRVI